MCKSLLARVAATFLSLCFLTFGFVSCDDDDEQVPQGGPSITSFSPATGGPGTVVTINGTNFDATPANNLVKFANVTATVNEATQTSLKVVAPADVVTGKIEVIVNNKSAMSAADFVVPPVITDFTPKSGIAGSNITITGKGFSSTVANNLVKINGTAATVTAASATSLTIQAPANGYSGIITVDVGPVNTATIEIFKYLPVITSFDPVRGAINSSVTITGSGFSQDAETNIVKIGDVQAEVISGTANELVIKVAEGTQTGNITVSSSGSVATSSTQFTVLVEAWRAGASAYDAGYSIGVDGAGNSYVTGSFYGTSSFGPTVLTGVNEEIFVAKYDPLGELVWAISAGGSETDRGASIVVDNAGNSYITGYCSNGAVFGSLPPVSFSGFYTNAFVAKVTPSGEFEWVQSFGGPDFDNSNSIAFDDVENLVIVGSYKGTMNIGATSLTSSAGTSAFVAKLNKSTGSPIWAKSFSSAVDAAGTTVTVNNDGDIYIGASFFGTMTVGTNTFPAATTVLNSFVLKLDDLGIVLWAKHLASGSWNNVLEIASDADGNCVLTGYISGSTTIGTSILNVVSNEDVILLKLKSQDGNVVFAKTAGGTDYDNGNGIGLDAGGNIYIAGHFQREATFGTHSVTSKTWSGRDVFVAKYDSNGNAEWVRSAGGDESDHAYALCVADDGLIYVTGSYRDFPGTFGGTTLENAGQDDMFVYRISP